MEHKENEKPEEKLLRQEEFRVDCPRRIVVGDPSYFEEFTGERLKRLTASYTPPHFYETRVLLTEVEFSDFPGERVCGLSVYMAPKETVETYVAGMMYEGQEACKSTEDYVKIAKTLDCAARETGVNFIGGYSALVSKGMTKSDELLIQSIPQALAETDYVCSSVNLGSTKTGLNMDAVKLMGEVILKPEIQGVDSLLASVENEELLHILLAADRRTLRIVLLKFMGYSIPEIILQTGMSRRAVYCRIHRLKKKIKKIF